LGPWEGGAHGGTDEVSVFVAALEVFHFTGGAGVDPLLEAGALFPALGGVGRGNGGDSGEREARFAGERVDEGLGKEHSIRLTQPQQGMRVRVSGTSEELTRSGDRSNACNPIIGEWIGTREMDGRKLEMHWFFYPAGKGLFLLPFLSQHGHYTMSNSTLRIEMPDTSGVDFKFQAKGNVLTLVKQERGESRFARY
jgi:hypothetical protein